MTSLRATQICQRSKVTRPAMSQLSERHISKTKFAKLLTAPTRGCRTIESPTLSCATVQPTKACQSSSTTASHQGQIISHL